MIRDIVPTDVLIEAQEMVDLVASKLDRKLIELFSNVEVTKVEAHLLADVGAAVRDLERLSDEIGLLIKAGEDASHWEQVDEAVNKALEASEEVLMASRAMVNLAKEMTKTARQSVYSQEV